MPENTLVKCMYLYLKHMHSLGHATWFSKVQVVVAMIEPNEQDNVDPLKLKNSHIRTAIRQRFEKNWQENIENVQISPKLRTYQLFKKTHEFEPYLHITNSKLRSAIAKFRTSAHSLEIERGRYAKPKTPVEKRICYVCDHKAIEDEFHFLIQCPLYQEERKKMYAVYDNEIGSINVLSDPEKFIMIMSSKSIKMLLSLGNFIVNSMGKRDALYAPTNVN